LVIADSGTLWVWLRGQGIGWKVVKINHGITTYSIDSLIAYFLTQSEQVCLHKTRNIVWSYGA